METQTENAALEDFVAWFINTGKNEVIVRAYQSPYSGNTLTDIRAYTISPDGVLRFLEYQCFEPLEHNPTKLIKMIGWAPRPEASHQLVLEQASRWSVVSPLDIKRKPVMIYRCTDTGRQTPLPLGSIDMLTHLAMAYASLLVESQTKEPSYYPETCKWFLRRWNAMYKQQKTAAIEHAKALAGIVDL